MAVWLVRAGEPEPPVGGEAGEWLLLTSRAVHDWDRARYLTQISAGRGLGEAYHRWLKTGGRREARQLDPGDDLQRLLGFLAPMARRRRPLRPVVRTAPEPPAATLAPLLGC
jgi:hypothetical protein